jgi:hypothetical protein
MFTAQRNLPMKCKKAPIHASSLSNAVHGCWRLLIVVMTLHMFSLPMGKINCITGMKYQWGDEMAEHSIVFAVEFFQSINISRLISYSFVVGLC